MSLQLPRISGNSCSALLFNSDVKSGSSCNRLVRWNLRHFWWNLCSVAFILASENTDNTPFTHSRSSLMFWIDFECMFLSRESHVLRTEYDPIMSNLCDWQVLEQQYRAAQCSVGAEPGGSQQRSHAHTGQQAEEGRRGKDRPCLRSLRLHPQGLHQGPPPYQRYQSGAPVHPSNQTGQQTCCQLPCLSNLHVPRPL